MQALEQFRAANFPKEYIACVDHRMRGSWDDQKATDEAFIQFHNRKARDRVMKLIADANLAKGLTSLKGSPLSVGKCKTDWRRGRDWAMRKSEEVIKTNIGGHAKLEYKASRESRRILVDGVEAFVQLPAERHGRFVGHFKNLLLE